MKKVEAMEWAADFAERSKIFTPPMKQNGYVADGYKPSTPIERAEIIMELARSVVDEPEDDMPVTGAWHVSTVMCTSHNKFRIAPCE